MADFIQNGDFCEVVSDNFVEHGVKRGHVVYVAGHKAFPITPEDPYTQRIKFFCNLYLHHTCEMKPELYIMDAVSLQRFDDNKQKALLNEYKAANGID